MKLKRFVFACPVICIILSLGISAVYGKKYVRIKNLCSEQIVRISISFQQQIATDSSRSQNQIVNAKKNRPLDDKMATNSSDATGLPVQSTTLTMLAGSHYFTALDSIEIQAKLLSINEGNPFSRPKFELLMSVKKKNTPNPDAIKGPTNRWTFDQKGGDAICMELEFRSYAVSIPFFQQQASASRLQPLHIPIDLNSADETMQIEMKFPSLAEDSSIIGNWEELLPPGSLSYSL